jgi:hypothetical protein
MEVAPSDGPEESVAEHFIDRSLRSSATRFGAKSTSPRTSNRRALLLAQTISLGGAGDTRAGTSLPFLLLAMAPLLTRSDESIPDFADGRQVTNLRLG